MMLKCGRCRLVYYCSIDCQKAARSQHKVVCVLTRNMEDVMGLSVGSFAEEETCSWIQGTLGCWSWCATSAACLSLSGWRERRPATRPASPCLGREQGTARPAELLAALKRVAPPPHATEQLEVGAKVELHSLNAAEHNGKQSRRCLFEIRYIAEFRGCSRFPTSARRAHTTSVGVWGWSHVACRLVGASAVSLALDRRGGRAGHTCAVATFLQECASDLTVLDCFVIGPAVIKHTHTLP
jgi:hypothetical protein